MRTLIFGAGPVGSVYAHLLHQSGAEVTVLARGERHDWLMKNDLVVVNHRVTDPAVIDAIRWSSQEVQIDHYPMLDRGGVHYVTYRQSDTDEYVELDIVNLTVSTVSSTFGSDTDLRNLRESGRFAEIMRMYRR